MKLTLATRMKDGILLVDCSGRIVFGEESSLLRSTVKTALSENNRIVLNLGEVNYIDSGGLGTLVALRTSAQNAGGTSDWDCSVAEARLETGDVLSLYTDGITETTGHSGEEFGEARVLDTLRRNQNLEAADILQNVEIAAQAFRLGEQEDDLTLVIARAR